MPCLPRRLASYWHERPADRPHAHALGLTLVTDSTREFSRIRGLNVENWLER